MIRLLFALLYLTCVVQGADTNATSSESTCSELLEGSYRSVWSILGSCATTLVVCLWHALHPDVPEPGKKWVSLSTREGLWFIWIAPEFVTRIATEQWIEALKMVIHFREKGYEWSMMHSYFAESGGFAYCDREGKVRVIKALEFLELCKAGKIDHPLVTENDLKDRSKTDTVSKAVFIIQLLWFSLQAAVRRSNGLVVTLLELETASMGMLAVFYLFLWWSKQLGVRRPHIFYESPEAIIYSREKLSEAWRPRWRLWWYAARRTQSTNDEEKRKEATEEPKGALNKAIHNIDSGWHTPDVALFVSWIFLGGLHLTAWNYQFPTELEKSVWHAAALVLTGGPIVTFIAWLLAKTKTSYLARIADLCYKLTFFALIVCRVILAALMFLSLRALPCSAHQIITWVQYIPHL